MESIVKLRKKIDLELSAISNMQQMSSWLLRKKKMATPFQQLQQSSDSNIRMLQIAVDKWERIYTK